MSAPVYIVLLNWNGWRDTLECLESVCRLSYENYRIVVCDNSSSDDSVQRIFEWAAGRQLAQAASAEMAGYSCPAVAKPITAQYLDQEASQNAPHDAEPLLTVIHNKANIGFAAGCNVGIRYAMDHGCAYIWLLNNDTVVHRDALSLLVNAAESNPTAGITGCTIWRYYEPKSVQAYGGTRYNRWMARTPRGNAESAEQLDCILGCSMLVSRRFIETIGLMDESYFLYFEELDWAVRGKRCFQLRLAADSHIYHKEGGSIGSSERHSARSLLSEFYLSRNRIVFTRKFYPWLMPSVGFWVAASALLRFAQGDVKRSATILSGALEGLMAKQ